MDIVHRHKRRAATHDNTMYPLRSSSYLPWTNIMARQRNIRTPSCQYPGQYSTKNSRFYSHASPALETIEEESNMSFVDGRDGQKRQIPDVRSDKEQPMECKHPRHYGDENVKQWVINTGCLNNESRTLCNVDDGILTTNNVRLHDIFSRQKLAKEYAPSSPVDGKDLKDSTPGSIFEKTEAEKCMPMVRANTPKLSDEDGIDCHAGCSLKKRHSETGGVYNVASYIPHSYRWADAFDSKDHLTPGRFRNICSGSAGKDRIEELSRMGREHRIHSNDTEGCRDNDDVNDDRLVCYDCLGESSRTPGWVCRRCQNVRMNRNLAEVQRKAYNIYLETGKLARKPGDVVEVVNYQNEDVKGHSRVKNRNIKKLFNRLGTNDTDGVRGNFCYNHDDDCDDDIYHNNDDYVNEYDNMYLTDGLDKFSTQNAPIPIIINKKKKKRSSGNKFRVKNMSGSHNNGIRGSAALKSLDIIRKNSVESWLKKRGHVISADKVYKSKRVAWDDLYKKGKKRCKVKSRSYAKTSSHGSNSSSK